MPKQHFVFMLKQNSILIPKRPLYCSPKKGVYVPGIYSGREGNWLLRRPRMVFCYVVGERKATINSKHNFSRSTSDRVSFSRKIHTGKKPRVLPPFVILLYLVGVVPLRIILHVEYERVRDEQL